MGSVCTDLEEFSVSLAGEGAPRAADGGCVLKVMYCEGEWGAAGEAHHSYSSTPNIQAEWVFCSGGGGNLRYCITQVHIYHGQISGGFIHIGHIPEW